MSIIEEPKPNLNPHIWNTNRRMHSRLKTIILHKLAECLSALGYHPNNWIFALNIIGSNTSNQYGNNSDLDVDVEIDMDRLKATNPVLKDKTAKEIKNIFNDHFGSYCNDLAVPGSAIPINFHCSSSQSSPVSEGVYSLLTSKWVKPPVFVPLAFRAEDAFSKEYAFVTKRLAPALKQLEDDLIVTLKETEDFEQVVSRAKKLQKLFKTLRNMRFLEEPVYTAMQYSLNWDYRNVLYKMLEQQGLLDIKEILVSAFPSQEAIISDVWNKSHYKSSLFIPHVKQIEKAFEKFSV